MNTQNVKILLIEDENNMAQSIFRIFKKNRNGLFKVDHSSNVSDGLELAKNKNYDLILLDLTLPDSQGYNTFSHVHTKVPDVPIVVLTGKDDDALALQIIQSGAQDYLVKGKMDGDLIVKSTMYAIERHRLQREMDNYLIELRNSERRFRQIIEKNTDGIIIINKSGIVQYVNPAAELLLKTDADQLIGTDFGFPIVVDEKTEIELYNKGKVTAIVEMMVVNTEWEGKKTYLISLHDITLHKSAEESLKKSNEELRKINQLKSSFIDITSHELRTPITSIKNALNIIASGKVGSVNEKQSHFFEMIMRNLDRLGKLVNDQLDLTKIESGKMQYDFTEVDLSSVLNRIYETFKLQADNKSIDFKINVAPKLPTVCADENRIEQILCNLINNALKFTLEGGIVQIIIKNKREFVEINVSDSGIGMDQEDQKSIFEPFYQTKDSMDLFSKGTGLGLAITKQLIEAHDGKICVESEPDKGSSFIFNLPVYSDKTLEILTLEDEIKKLSKYLNFSLFIADFEQQEQTHHKQLSDDYRSNYLNSSKKFITNFLPSKSHIIISQVSHFRLLIFLLDTNNKGGIKLIEKISHAYNVNPPYINGIEASLPKFYGPVLFPEDGTTGKSLIKRAYGLNCTTILHKGGTNDF